MFLLNPAEKVKDNFDLDLTDNELSEMVENYLENEEDMEENPRPIVEAAIHSGVAVGNVALIGFISNLTQDQILKILEKRDTKNAKTIAHVAGIGVSAGATALETILTARRVPEYANTLLVSGIIATGLRVLAMVKVVHEKVAPRALGDYLTVESLPSRRRLSDYLTETQARKAIAAPSTAPRLPGISDYLTEESLPFVSQRN